MKIGDIAQIHPLSKYFMMGIEFAEIKYVGRKRVTLHSELFNKTIRVTRFSILNSGLWNVHKRGH